ncbi:MAG: hypothetical protein LBQ76_08530 [Candidatus Fibromonas sp.]|jgi:hypothetical protein|nr:hypothetical protein [Candidatus Fibromonas sp.]
MMDKTIFAVWKEPGHSHEASFDKKRDAEDYCRKHPGCVCERTLLSKMLYAKGWRKIDGA